METILITRVIYLIKNKISSFDEINIHTLNEPQNADLSTGKKKQEAEEQKTKRAVLSKWKRNETKLQQMEDMQTETLKEALKYLHGS